MNKDTNIFLSIVPSAKNYPSEEEVIFLFGHRLGVTLGWEIFRLEEREEERDALKIFLSPQYACGAGVSSAPDRKELIERGCLTHQTRSVGRGRGSARVVDGCAGRGSAELGGGRGVDPVGGAVGGRRPGRVLRRRPRERRRGGRRVVGTGGGSFFCKLDMSRYSN